MEEAMFVKAQEFDRIINLNKIIMVDIEEEPNHFRIVAECENDFHVLLAVYVDGKDAETQSEPCLLADTTGIVPVIVLNKHTVTFR